MPTTILIIHGWKDSSKPFEGLKNRLRQDYTQDAIQEIFFSCCVEMTE